jgi:hypothetical protein
MQLALTLTFLLKQVAFSRSSKEALAQFIMLLRQDTFNVSHLFINDASLIQQYGPTPFITSLDVKYKVRTACMMCFIHYAMGINPAC